MLKLIHGDCLTTMRALGQFDMVFADPPDNLGLEYGECDDNLHEEDYLELLEAWFLESVEHAPIVWFSFYHAYTAPFGSFIWSFLKRNKGWRYRSCVQVYTFGQHRHTWLGNNHRPLWCIFQEDADFYPDAIRVPSWRLRNGDKRADPRGRVPGDVQDFQYPVKGIDIDWELIKRDIYLTGPPEKNAAYQEVLKAQAAFELHAGDVMDFPRVTGNSKHRCDWHPTQLHPEMIERLVKFCSKETGRVLDPFAGTGTTAKVCDRIGRSCTTVDVDRTYCEKIAADLDLKPVSLECWAR